MSVEMFRIHYSTRASFSSSARTEHLESRRALAFRLLELQSEVVAYPESGRLSFSGRIERKLRELRGKEDLVSRGKTRASKIFSVQQLVGDEWVDVEYKFVPATLFIGGEEFIDA
jgi:hypothetical protein